MIIIVFYVVGIVYLIIALAPIGNYPILIIGYFIFALGGPIVNSLYLTILQEVVPLEMQGRVNSIDIALSFSIIPIASLISGPIVEWIGIDYLFIILASLHLIILTFFVIFSDLRYVDKGIVK